ncbi:MAG TPA: hypothetical protein VJK51_03710 [Candidatus Nanoarchaeia archaeon]|nr:hypothetical protein [Candidatus Nanoarchaeia archaeon]
MERTMTQETYNPQRMKWLLAVTTQQIVRGGTEGLETGIKYIESCLENTANTPYEPALQEAKKKIGVALFYQRSMQAIDALYGNTLQWYSLRTDRQRSLQAAERTIFQVSKAIDQTQPRLAA